MAKFDSSKEPNFDSAKASKGRKPFDNPAGEKPHSSARQTSEQERGAPNGAKVIKPNVEGAAKPNNFREGFAGAPKDRYVDANRRVGNQARFHENTEVHTERSKDPLNSYIRKVLPAVKNPDEGTDRSYSRKAAVRVVGTGRKRTL